MYLSLNAAFTERQRVKILNLKANIRADQMEKNVLFTKFS